ncbi:MAG: DUF421 domain-containing protein [Bacilli bacterium]|nr:DUF421 domain-containing protein [Bacilli bacterium]
MFQMFQIIIRVILSYIIVYLTFRIMGKRELGELSIIDLIVFLMIAEIIALAIENLDRPFFYSVVTIIVLVLLQKVLSYLTLKNAKLRDTLEGKPSVIIANGKINYQEMKKQNYSFDDLIYQLRDRSVRSISEVDFAILEIDGTLSVFKKGESQISPLPLIISGNIVKENFHYVNITEEEVKNLLKEKGYDDIKEILYANYENNELFIVRTVK